MAFEYRYAGGLPDRLAWVAVELVHRPVDLIATFGTPPTLAAKQATTTIPIVMMGVGDPVGSGLVSSLARPAGNVTGNTILGPEAGPPLAAGGAAGALRVHLRAPGAPERGRLPAHGCARWRGGGLPVPDQQPCEA